MAYSAIFHGCLRATMSARSSGVQFRRTYRASVALPSASPVALRTGAALLRSVRPPTLLGRRMVACLAVEVDRRGRSGVASPFLHRQSSSYGRFDYQDVSSDESDLEVGSSQQQQMVSLEFS